MPPRLAEKIRRHLDTCDACRETVEALEQARGILRAAAPVRVPARFAESVQERLTEVVAGGKYPRQRSLGRLLAIRRAWAFAAGALLVLAGLVWLGVHSVLRSPAPPPEGTQIASPLQVPDYTRNEMDDFVQFCLERQSEYVWQRGFVNDASAVLARTPATGGAKRTLFPPRRTSQRAPRSGRVPARQTLPVFRAQGREWWWVADPGASLTSPTSGTAVEGQAIGTWSANTNRR